MFPPSACQPWQPDRGSAPLRNAVRSYTTAGDTTRSPHRPLDLHLGRCRSDQSARGLPSLAEDGVFHKTGRTRWDPTTVCEMLRNPVYRGMAMFGRTRSMPAKPRLRPIGRRTPAPKRASGSRSSTPREEWIAISVPALVDEAQFEAAQLQLDENRKRKREGRRRPGWLLQGLVVCRRCGYAFYGKMARGMALLQTLLRGLRDGARAG